MAQNVVVVVPLQGVWISGFSPRQQVALARVPTSLALRLSHKDLIPQLLDREHTPIRKSSLELSNLDNQLVTISGETRTHSRIMQEKLTQNWFSRKKVNASAKSQLHFF